jgi:hypothetical protein
MFPTLTDSGRLSGTGLIGGFPYAYNQGINWKTCEVHIQGLDMCDSKWYPSDWREV